MAKDKAAKERAREKRKKEQRKRLDARRVETRRAIKSMTEDPNGPKATIAMLSSLEEAGPLPPVPAFYDAFNLLLDEVPHDVGEGDDGTTIVPLRQLIAKVALTLSCDAEPSMCNGIAIVLFEGSKLGIKPLPGTLLWCTGDPFRWLSLAAEESDAKARAVFWLSEYYLSGFGFPLVIAEADGRLATWLLDKPEDGSANPIWRPLPRPRGLLKMQNVAGSLEECLEPDPSLRAALELTGGFSAEASPERLDVDSPAVRSAVRLIQSAQMGLALAVYASAQSAEQRESHVMALWGEVVRTSNLEREVDVLSRKLDAALQDLLRANESLARHAAARATMTTPTRSPEITLVQRLEMVFAQ